MSGIMIAATGYYTSFAALLATASRDSFFQNVRLLLNGESLVSATSNNTYVDSSASANAVTVSGIPVQGTFSPYRQPVNYSLDFSSTASKPLIGGAGSAAAIDPSASYTLEGFFYILSQGGGTALTGNAIVGGSNTAGSGGSWVGCSFLDATTLAINTRASTAYTTITLTSALPTKTWFHFALVCTVTSASSCTYKCYLNGVDVTTGTPTDTTTYASAASYYIAIGSLTTNANAGAFYGYISNLRFTTSATLYTGAFTPPTSALTTQVSSGTVRLLTGNSNSFINAGSTAMTLSATNVAITTLSPFNVSAFTANNSADFSATGTIIGSAGSAAAVDTANSYTLEGFFYQTAQGGGTLGTMNCVICTSSTTSSAGNAKSWGFLNSTTVSLGTRNNTTYVQATLTTALPLNAWFHFAIVVTSASASSCAIKCYLNGADVTSGTVTDTTTYAAQSSYYLGIGCISTNGAGPFNGYISNLRYTDGAALYTGAFTAPSSQLTTSVSSGSVTLLTCNGPQFTNSGSTSMTLTASANVKVSPLAPFSNHSWSTLFNGSANYLLLPTTQTALNFGTNNFTIECWVKLNSYPSATNYTIFGVRNTTDTMPWLFIGSTQIIWGGNVANFIAYTYTTTTLPIGQWVHLALVRSSTASTGTKLYVNGVLVATSALASAGGSFSYGTTAVGIGTNNNNAYYFNGNISNLRVVNGTALYTANFPPPLSPLTVVPNTALLTLQDNRFVDRSPNAYALTRTGTPTISASSPFEPSSSYTTALGGSVYFDGTATYLNIANTNLMNVGTNSFTVEAWVYLPSLPVTANSWIIDQQATLSTQLAIRVGISLTGQLSQWTGGTNEYNTTNLIPINQWTHVALVRNGTAMTGYINGVSGGTSTVGTNYNVATNQRIGDNSDARSYFKGYISGLRFVNGTAVYTANFAPPTTPPTAITNTSLLMNFTNAGVIDYSMSANMWLSEATAQTPTSSTTQVKYGSSSVYLPGSSNYIDCGAPLMPASGPYTIECWCYPIGTGTAQLMITQYGGGAGVSNQLLRYNDVAGKFSGGGIDSTGTFAINTWHHVALTRNSANLYTLWVNGTSQGTATDTLPVNQTPNTCIGCWWGGSPTGRASFFIGYMDDIRITAGVARYTTAFTPPTASLPTA